MYKYLLFSAFLISNLMVFSQAGSESPYSRYGIGDLFKNRVGQSRAMGGLSIALRSDEHVNYFNPASYTEFNAQTFVFEFGVAERFSLLSTESLSSQRSNLNIEYLTFGFPITKWWAGSIGLTPFSSTGYDIFYRDSLADLGSILYKYYGEGGINRVYMGHAFKFFKRLSLGINASYLFGSNVYAKDVVFEDDSIAFDYTNKDTTYFGDFYFDFGLQYVHPIKDKYELVLGATYSNKDKISAYRSQHGGIYYGTSMITVFQTEREKGYHEIPQSIGFGLSFSQKNKFIAGVDYYTQKWSQTSSFGESDSLSDSKLICFGGEYIPNADPVSQYWKKIRYRAGGHFSDTYLSFHDTQIKDFGISFGLGFPIKRTKTVFNVTFEAGQRGTITNNLLKENYYVISLNLSLSDTWFFKNKID
ncbi:MAG TPA: hypothetical protein DDX39_07020 [Bacteroidales bacterium]|nr:MAG: hypothetical protein A2W98_12255 [Bacteroidetes bacterium GWF2_33_38]OFY89829.1 MAG: hypothetical protein A2236_02440 [Bacteroidetes bacterium RIFOXYA2_FULL_33_7]HBF88380.1 hypothetical protein [Bacteroidales bacterium]